MGGFETGTSVCVIRSGRDRYASAAAVMVLNRQAGDLPAEADVIRA